MACAPAGKLPCLMLPTSMLDEPTDESEVCPDEQKVLDNPDLRNYIRKFIIAGMTTYADICRQIVDWRATCKAWRDVSDSVFYRAAYEAAFGPVSAEKATTWDTTWNIPWGDRFQEMCKGVTEEVAYMRTHSDAYVGRFTSFPELFPFERLGSLTDREVDWMHYRLKIARTFHPEGWKPTPHLFKIIRARPGERLPWKAYKDRDVALKRILFGNTVNDAYTQADVDAVRELFATDPKPGVDNSTDWVQDLPVQYAMRGMRYTPLSTERVEILRILLDNGAPTWQVDRVGKSLLAHACWSIVDNWEWTDLYAGYWQILALLLTPKTADDTTDLMYGPRVHLNDASEGTTPLHIAVDACNAPLALRLLQAGADFRALNDTFHSIVESCMIKVDRYNTPRSKLRRMLGTLLDYRVPDPIDGDQDRTVGVLEIPTYNGTTVLMLACQHIQAVDVAWLLTKGQLAYQVKATDRDGDNAISYLLKRTDFPRFRGYVNEGENSKLADLYKILVMLIRAGVEPTQEHAEQADRKWWNTGSMRIREALPRRPAEQHEEAQASA